MRVTLACALAVVSGGCSYYRPVPSPAPDPGTFVSVALTDSGSERLSRYLGPDVASVRGRLLSSDDTSYVMAVTAVDLRHGTALDWKGERVTLPRELVVGVSERRFSLGRSALAGGLSTIGVLLSFEVFKALGSGSAPGSGGGKPR